MNDFHYMKLSEHISFLDPHLSGWDGLTSCQPQSLQGDQCPGCQEAQLENFKQIREGNTLPETNSSHLKMDGGNTTFPIGMTYFQGLS